MLILLAIGQYIFRSLVREELGSHYLIYHRTQNQTKVPYFYSVRNVNSVCKNIKKIIKIKKIYKKFKIVKFSYTFTN